MVYQDQGVPAKRDEVGNRLEPDREDKTNKRWRADTTPGMRAKMDPGTDEAKGKGVTAMPVSPQVKEKSEEIKDAKTKNIPYVGVGAATLGIIAGTALFMARKGGKLF